MDQFARIDGALGNQMFECLQRDSDLDNVPEHARFAGILASFPD